jgi:hypothetical protein
MKKIVKLNYFLYICKVFIVVKQAYFFYGKGKNYRESVRNIWQGI